MQKIQMTSSVVITLALLAFAGCASAGNESLRKETEASVQKKVVEGKTTKAEIRTMFGSPATTSFTDGGLEIWNYELSKMKADAVNYIPLVGIFGSSASGTKKTLVVLFDDKGVVKKYSMSESPVNVKTGVFNNESEANKAPEPTTMAVTSRAPSSTSRASHGRGSSLTLGEEAFAMGLEFKIETYDATRTKLPELLRGHPAFLREEEGAFHLGTSPDMVLFSVKEEEQHIYVCQHVSTPETDALLGLLVRRVLSLNDHVVISEL